MSVNRNVRRTVDDESDIARHGFRASAGGEEGFCTGTPDPVVLGGQPGAGNPSPSDRGDGTRDRRGGVEREASGHNFRHQPSWSFGVCPRRAPSTAVGVHRVIARSRHSAALRNAYQDPRKCPPCWQGLAMDRRRDPRPAMSRPERRSSSAAGRRPPRVPSTRARERCREGSEARRDAAPGVQECPTRALSFPREDSTISGFGRMVARATKSIRLSTGPCRNALSQSQAAPAKIA